MKKLLIIFFFVTISNLHAFDDSFEDFNKTAQEILEQAYKMFEKSKEIIESFSQSEQQVVPESKNSFLLYYKIVKNSLPIEKRNDFLITAQIKYKISIQKDISVKNLLILSKNGQVELFGKVNSKDIADKVINISLKTGGVKEVISYLIIIEHSGAISL